MTRLCSGDTSNRLKGFKVTDAKRTKLCGVACKTLKELLEKGCTKLMIDPTLNIVVQSEDGTIIDDEYFQTLPPQTVFILLQPGENAITGAEILYNALVSVNNEYLQAGRLTQDFLASNLREKFREFSALLEPHRKPKIELQSRSEDPDWFEGLDTRAQTKEKFMFIRSQERIRGYYYKTADELKKSNVYKNNAKARAYLDSLFVEFRSRLKANEDFGCYFDRSARLQSLRLCDNFGEFLCQGRWDKNACLYGYRHKINPYESREARIVFSTWNLDHGVERTRSVIPAVIGVAQNHDVIDARELDEVTDALFSLLFTTKNLKIVNIICHDKGAHLGFTNECYDIMTRVLSTYAKHVDFDDIRMKCKKSEAVRIKHKNT